jgi:hypothetical protein
MIQDLSSSKDSHRIHLRVEPRMVGAVALESLGLSENIIWLVL